MLRVQIAGMQNALKSYMAAERGRQARLAAELDISASYLSDLAAGKKIGSLAVLRRISSSTGIPLGDLTGESAFSEGALTPFDPGPKGNSTAALLGQLYPGISSIAYFSAASDAHEFAIRAGDMLVTEMKFHTSRIPAGSLVVAQLVGDAGEGRTVVGKLADPWLLGAGGQSITRIGDDAAVVAVIRGIVRGSTADQA